MDTEQHWLIKWHYGRFLKILDTYEVIWKGRLHFSRRDDEGKRQTISLCGLTVYEDQIIYLNPSLHVHPTITILLETVVHESLHVLFGEESCSACGYVSHGDVFYLEKIVKELTDDQRIALVNALPYHKNVSKMYKNS